MTRWIHKIKSTFSRQINAPRVWCVPLVLYYSFSLTHSLSLSINVIWKKKNQNKIESLRTIVTTAHNTSSLPQIFWHWRIHASIGIIRIEVIRWSFMSSRPNTASLPNFKIVCVQVSKSLNAAHRLSPPHPAQSLNKNSVWVKHLTPRTKRARQVVTAAPRWHS